MKPADLLFRGGTLAFLVYLFTLTAGNLILLATLGLAVVGWGLIALNKPVLGLGLALYGIGIAAFVAMFAVLPAIWPFIIIVAAMIPLWVR